MISDVFSNSEKTTKTGHISIQSSLCDLLLLLFHIYELYEEKFKTKLLNISRI